MTSQPDLPKVRKTSETDHYRRKRVEYFELIKSQGGMINDNEAGTTLGDLKKDHFKERIVNLHLYSHTLLKDSTTN